MGHTPRGPRLAGG
ncbi:hypothetical protein YPPY61_1372, partial [Yersinia pestis PY-61]